MCHLYPYNNVKLLRKFFYINTSIHSLKNKTFNAYGGRGPSKYLLEYVTFVKDISLSAVIAYLYATCATRSIMHHLEDNTKPTKCAVERI